MATTTATVNKESMMYSGNTTTNYSTDTLQTGRSSNSYLRRWVMQITLPADPGGTITDVALNLTTNYVSGSMTLNIHELTQTAWVETEVSWANYASGSAWTSAGGDYNATVIDSVLANVNSTEYTVYLMGSSATNPLTLNWGDTVHIIGKSSNESTTALSYFDALSQTNVPTVDVTYTPNATNIKSINGVAHANIKNIGGLVLD